MRNLNNILFAVVDLELEGHTKIQENERQKAVEYIINALTLLPWFFRYPMILMIIFINLISLFYYRSVFLKISDNNQAALWNRLAGCPGYKSLKRLIRTLALLSVYAQYDKRS